MNEKPEHSDLDKFFQSYLKKDNVNHEEWNTPPLHVFSDAMKEIDAQDAKRKKSAWIWISFIAFVALFGVFVVWSNLKINRLEKAIDAISSNQVEADAHTEKINSPDSNHSNSSDLRDSDDGLTNEDAKTESMLEMIQSSYTSKASGPTDRPKIVNNEHENPDKKVSITAYNSPIQEIEVNADIASLDSFKIPTHDSSKAQQVKEIDVEVNNPIVKNEERQAKDDTVRNRPWRMFLSGGGNRSSMSMKANFELPDNLTAYDQWYSGFQINAGLRHRIKPKWTMDYSIGYEAVRNLSQFISDTEYKKANETVDGSGELIYTSNFPYASPISDYMHGLTFKLGSRSFVDGDEMKSITEIKSDFKIIKLRAGALFSMYQGKHIDINLRGGLSLNYFLNMQQEMNLKLYENLQMLAEDNFNSKSNEGLNSIFYGASYGLELNVHLSKRFDLGLLMAQEKSLSSIRKVDKVTEVSTSLNTVHSTLALSWKL